MFFCQLSSVSPIPSGSAYLSYSVWQSLGLYSVLFGNGVGNASNYKWLWMEYLQCLLELIHKEWTIYIYPVPIYSLDNAPLSGTLPMNSSSSNWQWHW
jgi:hypothetical protein